MAYFKESVIKQNMFPIGYIMITATNTNPSAQFGGTWISIGSGKTLVGVDENDADFNTVEKTGGSKSHTLTVDEIPSHDHSASSSSSSSSSSSFSGNTQTGHFETKQNCLTSTGSNFVGGIVSVGSIGSYGAVKLEGSGADHKFTITVKPSGTVSTTTTTTTTTTVGSRGGGNAFTIQNPYLTVYFWKKTA